ncbi:MAG: sigma-54 dependent transcriptional regulator [Candidatus Methylomirabilis sp.]|nr:sigma-54 dependent transcriptional regulator [Deltaproteobacteria bacterium]
MNPESAPPARVLVCEDEDLMRGIIAKILKSEGHEVTAVADAEDAVGLLEQGGRFDVILSDIRMPKMDGLEFLDRIRRMGRTENVLMITALASVETAVEAMRRGAYDYLTKPFLNEELKLRVRRAIQEGAERRAVAELRTQLQRRQGFEGLVGHSGPMNEVYGLVDRVAQTPSTVLIMGENGTGKELIARAIHSRSERGGGRFLAVNCAALAENLLESELFGHKRGSFTGAVSDKTGLFKRADDGTIFLDEIGEITPAMQVKLLRALQEHEVTPVGATEPVAFSARILAATNKDLEKEVAEGRFREDLFYRLNVVTIELPPLRERAEDVPLLAQHFLDKYASEFGKGELTFGKGVLQRLVSYNWPGNVRELENTVERAVALARSSEIGLEDLPKKFESVQEVTRDPSSMAPTLEEVEKRYIQEVVNETRGDKVRAADILGINLSTLYRKIKTYKLAVPER